MIVPNQPQLPPPVESVVVIAQEHTQVSLLGIPFNTKLILWTPYKVGRTEFLDILDYREISPKKAEGYILPPKLDRQKLTFYDTKDGVIRTIHFMHYIKTQNDTDIEYVKGTGVIKREFREGLPNDLKR